MVGIAEFWNIASGGNASRDSLLICCEVPVAAAHSQDAPGLCALCSVWHGGSMCQRGSMITQKAKEEACQNTLLPPCVGMAHRDLHLAQRALISDQGTAGGGIMRRQQSCFSSSKLRNLSGLRNTDRVYEL